MIKVFCFLVDVKVGMDLYLINFVNEMGEFVFYLLLKYWWYYYGELIISNDDEDGCFENEISDVLFESNDGFCYFFEELWVFYEVENFFVYRNIEDKNKYL